MSCQIEQSHGLHGVCHTQPPEQTARHTSLVVQKLGQTLTKWVHLSTRRLLRDGSRPVLEHGGHRSQVFVWRTSLENDLNPWVRSSSAHSERCCWKKDCAPSAGDNCSQDSVPGEASHKGQTKACTWTQPVSRCTSLCQPVFSGSKRSTQLRHRSHLDTSTLDTNSVKDWNLKRLAPMTCSPGAKFSAFTCWFAVPPFGIVATASEDGEVTVTQLRRHIASSWPVQLNR
jgi:hypothetical protein